MSNLDSKLTEGRKILTEKSKKGWEFFKENIKNITEKANEAADKFKITGGKRRHSKKRHSKRKHSKRKHTKKKYSKRR